MKTDRQLSFTATFGTETTLLNFLDIALGKRAIVNSGLASGGFFTGKRQSRDDSHLIGFRPDVPVDAKPRLQLYFRHTQRHYRLYVRTAGDYYGKCLSMSDNGLLGAFPSDDSNVFALRDERGNMLTLDTIKSESLSIYLQPKESGLLHQHKEHDSTYLYVADKGDSPWLSICTSWKEMPLTSAAPMRSDDPGIQYR
ncbi:hypothetical protein [Pseudomonas sp. S2_F03]